MQRILLALPGLAVLVPSILFASPPADAPRQADTAWARSLDKETIRRAVHDHEQDPLSQHSREQLAPVLLAHFEDVPFIVCLDQVPGVTEQGDLGKALVWQIVFGSGVFLEEHPDRTGDREAYMLAGLESAVRAYRNVLARNPQVKIAVFDQLDALQRAGRLPEHVRAHACEKG
jgi:hypothetical protein